MTQQRQSQSIKHLKSLARRRKHVRRKRRIAEIFIAAGEFQIGFNLQSCNESEVLACCSDCGNSWYVLHRCRSRVCPLCSYETTLERQRYVKLMLGQMKFPKLITLTMDRWRGDPAEGIKYIREKFSALRRTKLFSQAVGGCYQIEVVPKNDGYHIHIHSLVDMPYLPYQQLFSVWRQLINEPAPQIHITAAISEKQRNYTIKYATKAIDFDTSPEDMVRWYRATRNARLFATFGRWYNATLADLLPDGEHFIPVSRCPFCGSEKSIFLAEQGPYIWGHDDWLQLEPYYTRGKQSSRRLPGVEDALENWQEYVEETK